MRVSIIAFLGLSSTVLAQPRNHFHHHHVRNASPAQGPKGGSSVVIKTAVVTVYELNGQKIPVDQVQSCLRESKCVIVGSKITGVSSAQDSVQPIIPTTSPSVSINEKITPPLVPSSQVANPSPSQGPVSIPDIPVVHASVKSATSSANNVVTQSQTNNLAVVNSEFPSGKIDCSEFPSAYGAVAADWVGLGGWTGVQKTPGYSSSSKAIGYIETATAGDACTAGSFCSYACPAGYQKSQWPTAQGSSGQSIGGLYCNSDGKLVLSRTSTNQLCTPGVGDVQVKNLQKKNVAICRTDYPGTEAETVALNVLPGSTVKVTCPDSKTYYRTWEGAPTSAQYYINPSGYDVGDACNWGTAGSNLGNWAPVNMGVGRSDNGVVFVSLFPNLPTNPDGVLDFNIDITGDINGHCSYRNGKYFKDGTLSPNGCTVGVNGKATLLLS